MVRGTAFCGASFFYFLLFYISNLSVFLYFIKGDKQ